MPERVGVDDLLFAPVRARWLSEPRQVAADLLEAAEHSERLNGVTPQSVTVRAARLLLDFGEQEDGLALLRRVIADTSPDADGLARFELALVLAQSGDPDEAQAVLLDSISCEPPDSLPAVFRRSQIAVDFVYGGHLDLAVRWADSAVDAAEAGKEGPLRGFAVQDAQRSRAEVLEMIRVARDEGPQAARQVIDRLTGLTGPLDIRPWPALVGDCLLWWPAPEYQRIVRQVSEVTHFLGAQWSDHRDLVESTMRAVAAVSPEPLWVVAASFEGLTMFVLRRKTDPRDASTMTACTAFHAADRPPVRWPPSPRKPCWCQSGLRYKVCCATR